MTHNPDKGVYVTLNELVKLRLQSQGFSFLPKQAIHSLLSGQKTSRLRGRGLNFEEIRHYLPGDDVRNIDWKVTARMRGDAHVRVYTEERDRPALIIVDQRANMFFGSVNKMKSVAAAETAAIAAWRVIGVKDRIGALVFNDSEIRDIRPGGNSKTVVQILKQITQMNNALKVDDSLKQNSSQLNKVLKQAAQLASHDYLVFIISDMNGADAESKQILTRMARHNDVMIGYVHDPMEEELPDLDNLVVSDGDMQLLLKTGKKAEQESLSRKYSEHYKQRIEFARHILLKRQIPLLAIDTVRSPLEQIREVLGLQSKRGAAWKS